MELHSRARRPRGTSAELRVGVGVMLLGVCLAQSVQPQAACSSAASLPSLNQPKYQNTTEDIGAGFMAVLVHSFLQTVQPKPFPGDLIQNMLNQNTQVQLNQEMTKEALLYEIGFLVCAAIGVLYIVLMPIVGFLLACCRCCGNCGGRMYQKQTSSIHCRRRTLYWSAFITTVIILAGNICMFKSNANLSVSVAHIPKQLNKTMDNINVFITSVPQQVDYVVSQSSSTIQQVDNNLDAIGPQLGTLIEEDLLGVVSPVLGSVGLLGQEAANIGGQLNTLNSSLAQLQSSLSLLQNRLTNVNSRISDTLSDPGCNGCGSQRSQLQLTLDTSLNTSALSTLQSSVDVIININLASKVNEVDNFFNSIPQMVTNNTKNVVQSSKQQLANLQTQISQVTGDIPLSALNSVSVTLAEVQGEVSSTTPDVQKAEFIRWSVCTAICCVVLLVVVCNVLGLVLGPMGLTSSADPINRSSMANCGGIFLMMAAGFSFLVSWLFMILVLLLFLLGGNVYTLVCQPWSNGELLNFIDTPGLIPNLNLGQALGLKSNLNISKIYRDCEQNQPVWTTLQLNELINLDDLLNVSKYTVQLQQQFDNININLPSITLLDPQVEAQLRSFSAKANNFDTSAFTKQMSNISSTNLNTSADVLDQLSLTTTSNTIKQQLEGEAKDLRNLQINIETVILPQVKILNLTILHLKAMTNQINQLVGEVLQNVGTAQGFLNTNTTQIVQTESRQFVDCQLGYFTAFADWAKTTITQQVGRCQPVAGAVDTVQMIVCSQMVESLNAFWFSLGWCLSFFIPSIIFSIKLSKYYRRMKSSDVYDDQISNQIHLMHIPRAQVEVS